MGPRTEEQGEKMGSGAGLPPTHGEKQHREKKVGSPAERYQTSLLPNKRSGFLGKDLALPTETETKHLNRPKKKQKKQANINKLKRKRNTRSF